SKRNSTHPSHPPNHLQRKPHFGPARCHTGSICRIEEESLSQSEHCSSDSKQEKAGTKQEMIFDLPSDNSDVTLSDIERYYDIGRTVGDGNFAVVRECRRHNNGEAFAIKIVERSKLIGREHMMQNELSILGSLSHPRSVCVNRWSTVVMVSLSVFQVEYSSDGISLSLPGGVQ
uniref:Protein kinase domain-containing protein n=1 Tax=Oncorhynchus tshawytscha TaxID=74940 RepID=A0A8C8EIF5_ONCTS